MIVKIRDKTYSAHEEPILFIFDPDDHVNIRNMEGDVLCIFPGSMDPKEVRMWMTSNLEGETE